MSVISSFKQSMRTVYIVTVSNSSFLICGRKLGMQFDHHHQVLPSILQEFMDQFNHFSMHKRDIFRRIEVAADTVEEPMVPIKEMLLHLLPKSASRQKIYAFPVFATRLLSKSGTIKRYLLHTKQRSRKQFYHQDIKS